jgi:hypothetical protein
MRGLNYCQLEYERLQSQEVGQGVDGDISRLMGIGVHVPRSRQQQPSPERIIQQSLFQQETCEEFRIRYIGKYAYS